MPRTSTAEDGVPGANFYKRLQLFAQQHGYTGPVDGVLGKNSWAGDPARAAGHRRLHRPGGWRPGSQHLRGLQRLAAQHGYSGPVDGALGPNSYRGLAAFLNAKV